MRSCLYECEVWHERNLPRFHSFTTKHFMFYVHLHEMETNGTSTRLLGFNRSNIFSFFEKDFLPDIDKTASPLIERVKKTASRLGARGSIERIELLTNVRIFGYVFNPVSFYFCFGAMDQLICCICEVGNTFGEKKAFILEPDVEGLLKKRQKKFFYVSPFTNLDQEFVFDIPVPSESVDIQVDTMDGDTAIVRASLHGRRIALTDGNLVIMLLRYSWATAKIIALIHFHALILWFKGVPFHRKEEAPDMQLDILNAKCFSMPPQAVSIKVNENEHISQ